MLYTYEISKGKTNDYDFIIVKILNQSKVMHKYLHIKFHRKVKVIMRF